MNLRIPPVLMLVICIPLSWGLAFLLPVMSFGGAWRYAVAVAFLLIAFVILFVAVRSFHVAQTTVNPFTPDDTEQLVTTGLYRFSRNPMYVAMASILVGIAFFFGNIASFLSVVLFCCVITQLQIKPEEKVLAEMFGQSFLDYSHRTRRWM